MALLQVNDVSKSFGGLRAVAEVSFSVAEGEIVGLIGPNGAGKTTMFNLITGWQVLDSGKISFNGMSLTGLQDFKFAQSGLVRTFQGTKIFRNLTVRQNLVTACNIKNRTSFVDIILRRKRTIQERNRQNKRVQELMELVGIADQADIIAESLAYAHQSLLGIAMALALEPKILLMDEPFAGMNPTETENVIKLVRSIRDQGVTILIIEHNLRAVMSLCDRIVVMESGRVISEGTPEVIRNDEKVIETYLGRRGTHAKTNAGANALR
ncbi:ABC transporter ATP-binding protein [Neobacillus niacini]|uniref:ABC transporter ATP-binding protein n=1 Tax=Neobacillus niacini TaxID=86668 RepID=UPI002FFD99CE